MSVLRQEAAYVRMVGRSLVRVSYWEMLRLQEEFSPESRSQSQDEAATGGPCQLLRPSSASPINAAVVVCLGIFRMAFAPPVADC